MPRVAKGHVEQLPSGSWRVSGYTPGSIRSPSGRSASRPPPRPSSRRTSSSAGSSSKPPKAAPPSPTRRWQAAGPVRGDRAVGCVHAADQRGIHPPHHQACSGAPGDAEGPRPDPRPAVRAAQALRRPVLHRQAVHRAPQHPSPGHQPARRSRPAWQQVTETFTEAIRSGALAPGDELPSITELSALQGIGTGVIRHALETLVAAGLIVLRHGRPRSWQEAPTDATPILGGGPGPAMTAAAPGAVRTSVTR